MSVAALVPVLDRPARVAPLVESIHASSDATPILLCSLTDTAEIDAVVAAGEHPHIVQWEPGRADYSRKINWGFRRALSMGFEWMLLAADDLRFHEGWVEACLAVYEATGACVIGSNDLGNPAVRAGRHATHSLVHKDYLECGTIDEPNKILHEGYWHNFCDNECVATARRRDTFAFAQDAVIEHLHPNWRKGEWDATYTLGQAHFEDDRRLHRARSRLWGGPA